MKELTRAEIQAREEEIEKLRGIEQYKYYFTDEKVEPMGAWEDGGYYVDLTEYEGVHYVGVIKLGKEPCGFSFLPLLRSLANEYGRIALWCDTKNKKSMRFHELLEKKLKAKRAIAHGTSVILIEGRKECENLESTEH